jgi:ribosomal protein L21E
MKKVKTIREKGKIKLSRYFQEFKNGDKVAVVSDVALQPQFPKRIHGSTGVIIGKRGNANVIQIRTQGKEKQFLIKPVHLIKIK